MGIWVYKVYFLIITFIKEFLLERDFYIKYSVYLKKQSILILLIIVSYTLLFYFVDRRFRNDYIIGAPIVFSLLYYFITGRKDGNLFVFEKKFQQFAFSMLPCIIAFVVTTRIDKHFEANEERLHHIENVGLIRGSYDSVDVYIIQNYYIGYNKYKEIVEVENDHSGRRTSKEYYTTIESKYLCPLYFSKDSISNPKCYVLFVYYTKLDGTHYENSYQVNSVIMQHRKSFMSRESIYYFRETRYEMFDFYGSGELDYDLIDKDIVEAGLSVYEPYNGYYFLDLVLWYIIGIFLLFVSVIFFQELKDEVVKKVKGEQGKSSFGIES